MSSILRRTRLSKICYFLLGSAIAGGGAYGAYASVVYYQAEEQRVMKAVEEQRKLDESLSKMALELEMRRIRNNTEVEFDAKILEKRKMWEREMDMQLRRAAIAHAEHLERVIKTQKQLHDVENQQLNEVKLMV
uniref:MICOS complex subunit MIC60 n=1 Tax=Globodera pallida TaxID=36090 RepID=A0A183C8D6_GLOPA